MLYQDVIVNEFEAGLLYDAGRFVRRLEPGRFRVWNVLGRAQRVEKVDTRQTILNLTGQEMLTADKVTLRLNLAVTFRVSDPVRAVNTVQNYLLSLHTGVQLALRSVVTATDLDTLMADRDAVGEGLLTQTRPAVAALGVTLESVGVRDIILPAEVKKMLAREAEALREGRAALVAAREETAATRATLNTARLLADNPTLMQLKGLQALEAVAGKNGNTVVFALPSALTAWLSAQEKERG